MAQRKNILEALYYGDIAPWEKRFDHSPEYEECVRAIFNSEEKLTACLNEAERELLSQLMDAEGDLSEYSTVEYFIEGFRLGARFMLDTFLTGPLAPSVRELSAPH